MFVLVLLVLVLFVCCDSDGDGDKEGSAWLEHFVLFCFVLFFFL